LDQSYKTNENTFPGLPSKPDAEHIFVRHRAYTAMYDLKTHNPDWVSYCLTKEDVGEKNVERKGYDFTPDPEVQGCAIKKDYSRSGYDRGHMAPAEEMRRDPQIMAECFYMTNMCPQKHSLNGGIWKTFEEDERRLAEKEGKIWIVSGPVYLTFTPEDICRESFGRTCSIIVPQAFYKVIYYRKNNKDIVIALILPHKNCAASGYSRDLKGYFTTVEEIEKETGLNFLSNLSQSEKKQIEKEKASIQVELEFLENSEAAKRARNFKL
jgi:endonuclease G